MKNKSIPSFVLGLIGLIADAFLSYYLFVVLILFIGFIENPVTMVLGYVIIVLMIPILLAALVGCISSFLNAKVSGICFSISCILLLVETISLFIMAAEVIGIAFLLFIPLLCFLISSILSFKANKKYKTQKLMAEQMANQEQVQ